MRHSSNCIFYCGLALLLASLHFIMAIPTPAEDPIPNMLAKRSVASGSDAVAPVGPGVDIGDDSKRVVRDSEYDEEWEDDDSEKHIVPELIPIAENRKTRGNGADDLNAVANENGVEVVDMGIIMDERQAIADGLMDGDVEMDSSLGGRLEKCSKEGEVCQENSGCCSGFCSWTRGFTCYTVSG